MGTSSRLRTATLRGLVPLGLVSVALAGCSTGSGEPAPTQTVTQTVAPSAAAAATPTAVATTPTPAPVQTPQPSATPTCGAEDPTSAIQQAADRLGAPAGIDGATWDTASAERDGYDPCAALSWVVLRPAMSTGSSPSAILLFHDGAYLGTATKEQYSFEPDVVRTSDVALTVTYRFPLAGEGNAEASGRAEAAYRWDDGAGRVVMTGDVPPTP
jgi:hypothetical protein